MANKEIKPSRVLALSAIGPYEQSNLPIMEEKEISGKDFISYGEDNSYPSFLFDLYNNVSTLQSIINGTVDFIAGNGIENDAVVNAKGDKISDIIGKIATDYLIFGGYALNIIRNFNGNVSEIYYVDFSKVRSNKNNTIFYVSNDWSKSYGRVKYHQLPKFEANDTAASSILYYKGAKTRGVYPVPVWNAAIENCLVEKKINQFHLNSISNGFSASYVLSLNNGVPDEAQQLEMERGIEEKFTGSENAGRFLLIYAKDKEHSVELSKIESDDFASRYEALAKRSREQIFISFRAIPQLFGDMSAATGFSTQEFEESFKLYNRTCVKPIQNQIVKTFEALGKNIKITPFNLED